MTSLIEMVIMDCGRFRRSDLERPLGIADGRI